MSDTLVIQTSSGPIRGFVDTLPLRDNPSAFDLKDRAPGHNAPLKKWLGVPYGQAERWKQVRPPKPWEAVRDCYELGDVFPQPPSVLTSLWASKEGYHKRDQAQSEDAFNLNVWGPGDLSPEEKLPVMVWVHGGSLLTGAGSGATYDPSEWIRRSQAEGKRFIVVSGNYRLGLLGFGAFNEIGDDDDGGLNGNYGLRDVLSYFEWVQANIGKFGGDRENVTAFGESAGGVILGHLLFSGRKIFQRAILQSGFPGTMPTRHVRDAVQGQNESLLSDLGIKQSNPKERIDALRQIPIEKLSVVNQKLAARGFFGMVLETGPNAIWKEPVVDLLRKGLWDPWISEIVAGTNEHEGTLFSHALGLWKPSALDRFIKQHIPPEYQERVAQQSHIFSGNPDPATRPADLTSDAGAGIFGNRWFYGPQYNFINHISAKPNAASGKKTILYVYRLRDSTPRLMEGTGLGHTHAVDLHLLFNLNSLWHPNDGQAKTSKALGDSWVAFASTGSPGGMWEPYDPRKPVVLVFKENGATELDSVDETEDERRTLWAALTERDSDVLAGRL